MAKSKSLRLPNQLKATPSLAGLSRARMAQKKYRGSRHGAASKKKSALDELAVEIRAHTDKMKLKLAGARKRLQEFVRNDYFDNHGARPPPCLRHPFHPPHPPPP